MVFKSYSYKSQALDIENIARAYFLESNNAISD